jgi:hypothetical protein
MVDLRKNVMKQFSKQIESSAKQQLGLPGTDSSGISHKQQQSGPIDWHHYNYPPLLKLIHYSTKELKQPQMSTARKLHAVALIIIVNTWINRMSLSMLSSIYIVLNCIIEVATTCND